MGDLHRLPGLPRDERRVIDVTVEEMVELVVSRLMEKLGAREIAAGGDAVSTKRMAEILGKHHSTIQKWTSIESCPAFRSGKRPWAWPVDETRAWVREYFNG
jgi:hypothetical protein